MVGPVPKYRQFARNLRALAGRHDLTGTDLAARLALTRPAVSDLMLLPCSPPKGASTRLRTLWASGKTPQP